MQSLFGDEGRSRQSANWPGAMRDRTGNLPSLYGHLPGLLRPDCPQPTRGSRADDGAVGHALAAGADGRHQEAREKLQAKGKPVDFKELLRMDPTAVTNVRNVNISALAALARHREPLRGALDEFFRE